MITCRFFSLHIANKKYKLLFAFYSYPGASVTENPVTHNALGNMGTQMNPMPIPINFPRPSIQVRFFSGMGMGGPKKPQGHPCRSLIIDTEGTVSWCVSHSLFTVQLTDQDRRTEVVDIKELPR